MTVKKSPKTITVSFRENEFDDTLYKKIIDKSIIVGQSSWMKLAAWEKLERDEKDSVNTNNTATKNNNNSNNTIQSLDQIFKKP